MTSNTLGTQWAPRLLDQPKARTFQQPTRPLPRHQSRSGTVEHPFRSDSEPAFKKQRLSHEAEPVASPLKSNGQHAGLVGDRDLQSPHSAVRISSVSARSLPDLPTLPSTPPLLFPFRSAARQLQNRLHRHNTAIKRKLRGPGDVQIKPFVPESPSLAPRYQLDSKATNRQERTAAGPSPSLAREGVADFSPWKGNHAEDVLSETTTKHGFYDKIQVSQTESSTARPSIWSSLRHKSGVQVLSSLVVSVLDQRQAHGTNTTGCTFRPPPRVTLTDSKREAWLRDLANPTIPLRRLSRTIPHGIRGRALLDRCLGKNIPTARSLWLAKCVGANEIRAFKRKGASGAFAVGGETKWIRDWTANVEQFLDAIIDSCSSSEWKENIIYGLRLVIHLLAEGLLDRDHYFDWLLNALDRSDSDTLSVYLLIVRTHLDELGHHRRLGHRLVESLLEHLHNIESCSSPDVYDTLTLRGSELVRSLVVSSPASFLLPKSWHKYETMLQAIVGPPNTALYANFEDLRKRNARLRALAGAGKDSELMVHQTIVKILDSTRSCSVDITRVAHDLRSVADVPNILVQNCLEWSASIHRYGHARVYIAARLLRRWSGMGIDIETPILDFIAAESDACGLDLSSFYRVVVELVRSRHFSVGSYLQWVIANGVLRQHDILKSPSCAVGLLFAFPLDDLPTHVQNLRQNLLRSIGVSSKHEQYRIAQVKTAIERQIRREPQGDESPIVFEHPSSCCPQESLTVKSSIGRWIRQKVTDRSGPQQAVVEPQSSEPDLKSRSSLDLCDNIAELQTLIRALEDLDDYTTMAAVLTRSSTSQDAHILAMTTVTVSHYLDIFNAVGAADKLFMQIFQRQATLEARNGRVSLLEALFDLARSLPNRSVETRALQNDLQKYDSKVSVAACSPISEHMLESLQCDESKAISTCTDEIEQLLASGSSMDKRLLRSVFELVWKRFEATWTESVQSSVAVASLIPRLRTFDTSAINDLMTLRVERTLSSEARPKLMRIGMPLVCAQSITLEQLLGRVLQLVHGSAASFVHESLLIEAVELLVADRQKVESSINHLYYRFYAQQQRLVRGSSPTMKLLLQHVVRSAYATRGSLVGNTGGLLQDSRVLSMLRLLPDSVTSAGSEDINDIFGCVVTLGGAAHTLRNVVFPAKDAVEAVLSGRRGELSHLVDKAVMNDSSKVGEDASQLLISTISELASSSSVLKTQMWARMIAALPLEQRLPIRDKAKSKLFALLADTSNSRLDDFPKLIQCLMSCMSRADDEVHSAVSAARTLAQIYENLAHLTTALHHSRLYRLRPDTSASIANDTAESFSYMKLKALLQILYIHQSAFSASNVSDSMITQLLVLISRLLVHPFPDRYAHMSDEICDFLIVIVTHLSPAIRSHCIRTLHNQHHLRDSRLSYVYGHQGTTEDNWLQLVTGSTPTRKATHEAFPIRRWETLPDATPLMTANDTSVSLTLFGARKAVL